MALAGFTVGEAEGLRRAMSRKRSREAIEALRARFVEGAGAQRRRRGDGGPRLRQARRLLGLRLPEVARGRVRAARLPVGLAAPPLPGRVPLRAPERPADGLLPAGQPRPRRPAARGRGAAARREPERGDTARCEERRRSRDRASATSGRSGRTTPRRSWPSASERAVPRRRRPRPAASPLDAGELEALVAAAPATASAAARELLWGLGLARARDACGARRKPARAAARADRRRPRSCPTRPPGSGCSPTTA